MRTALVALLLLPLCALADVESRFAKLRDDAQPLGALGPFLDKYVGECRDPLDGAECRTNAAEFRKKANGKSFYMIVGEEAATMLAPGPYNPRTGEFTINVTPFFPANGYAITEGAPKKTDGNGNPVLPYLAIRGQKESADWNGSRFNALFARRGLRLQMVFTPKEVWTTAKGGGGKNYGMAARIQAIVISEARTGDVLATWYAGK